MLNVIPNVEMGFLLAPKLLGALAGKTLTHRYLQHSVAVIHLSGFAAGMMLSCWESPAKEFKPGEEKLELHVAVVSASVAVFGAELMVLR